MQSQFNPRPGARPAFTLVELMISIALVLLLMLGINQVFKVTGEAVGTNAAISTGVRDARAAQNAFGRDIAAWAPDSPAIIIRSERVSAFRNRADMEADRDWTGGPTEEATKRTVDIDGNGIEGEAGVLGERISPAIYNSRSHRVDVLSFFGRGLFRRQTGGSLPPSGGPQIYLDEYVADMSATEAWIWYGHLRRPDESSPVSSNQMFEHRDPGANPNLNVNPPDRNDRNFFATDFVLGRIAILLTEGDDTNGDDIGDEIRDRRDTPQRFIARTERVDNIGTDQTDTLAPLKVGIESNDVTGGPWELQWARYDLANTSIPQLKTILRNYQNAWDFGSVSEPWYDGMGIWRFQGDPQPLRPFSSENAARTTPVFLERCTQFIVEYAGDFVTQDAGGNVTAYRTDVTTVPGDGIDFIIDNSTGTPVRRIRWYGMPRDVAGASNGGPDGLIPSAAGANRLTDVVPLRDVLGGLYPPALPPGVNFIERRCPNDPSALPPNTLGPPPADYTFSTGGMLPGGVYIAAWGPDTGNQPRPEMIRIVITLDDPEGRIADGQTFEYVFRIGG